MSTFFHPKHETTNIYKNMRERDRYIEMTHKGNESPRLQIKYKLQTKAYIVSQPNRMIL